ncbi:MAG: diguanylate cyclase [Nitrospiraceae bacterium]|nr:diguanylate cyclase [Nitrospiraceae bacterium]
MAKAKILFVEDNKTQARVTKEFLEKNGYDVYWVEDGKSAIKSTREHSFDVIILDLILPDLNGNEVCRWLKMNDATRGIPIIILTAKNSIENKVEGLEAGADDYLSKPYMDTELNARIYACLRTKALQDELLRKNRQLEDLLSKVEVLAITDPLTGLFNRRRFETIFEKELKRAIRHRTPVSCMMIDIDHFKAVNDTFGHRAGDSVLIETAAILKKSVREIDLVARWGGEEFIVLLPQSSSEDAMRPASRILESISGHEFAATPGSRVTVSIGLANSHQVHLDTDGEKLINSADIALYDAKRRGRNRIELFREK